MESRDYQPPVESDYDNVIELNRAYLAASGGLSRPQQKRLANAPFLLFSLRERQLDWWNRALAEQPDLLRDPGVAPEALRQVQCAALGFLWHLADRNAYAARIVSGASTAWCEKLTSVPLVTLIHRVGDRGDLLVSRIEKDQRTDRPSQLVTLHGLLTRSRDDAYVSLPAAACSMPATRMRVAEKRERKKG